MSAGTKRAILYAGIAVLVFYFVKRQGSASPAPIKPAPATAGASSLAGAFFGGSAGGSAAIAGMDRFGTIPTDVLGGLVGGSSYGTRGGTRGGPL